ncbi:MAG: GTPase HflX [Holophagales bacterium]|nr:GTPase HflX [Holophagales bacterium]
MKPEEAASPELCRHLARVSREIGRQVGVLVTREGAIQNVIVGDAHRIDLPDIGRLRGGAGRFRALRLVHTHLRGEGLSADDLADLALLRLDAVMVVQALEDGVPGAVEVAMLQPAADDEELDLEAPHADPFRRFAARDIHSLDLELDLEVAALEEELARLVRGTARTEKERALLIGVVPDDDHFHEMVELVAAAGVELAGTSRQRRFKVHPKTVVGKGKLQDIVLESMRRGADVAIFDIDLKPAQARAFEDATGLKAIDRTQLILDIFAQRAKSRDGKLQVELAQREYSLPRLTEKDAGLSRLAGGIGGRGPGETVLEIGRRRLRDRIRALQKQIDALSKQRDVRRRRRREEALPILSIVGYTNAGKSTLLNAMTNARVEAQDKLFMTLDPTSRRLRFPREGEVVLTDTVGFLSDLPKDLVAAFRATLEELADADLLLHVVDAADEALDQKRAAVESLLDELGLAAIPRLLVLNKTDLLPPVQAEALARRLGGVLVSARERRGMGDLIAAAEGALALDEPLVREYPGVGAGGGEARP